VLPIDPWPSRPAPRSGSVLRRSLEWPLHTGPESMETWFAVNDEPIPTEGSTYDKLGSLAPR
jgi:hypothetical protein